MTNGRYRRLRFFPLSCFVFWTLVVLPPQGHSQTQPDYSNDILSNRDAHKEMLESGNESWADWKNLVNNKGYDKDSRHGTCLGGGGAWRDAGDGECDISGTPAGKLDSTGNADEKSAGEECDGVASQAMMACDPLHAAGMSSQASMMVQMALQQGAGIAQSLGSIGKGVTEQCQGAADLSKMMGAGQGAQAAACMAAQERCTTVCEEAKTSTTLTPTQKSYARRKVAECNNYSANLANQVMQVMNYANTWAGSTACVKQTKDMAKAQALQNGEVDCNNPNLRRSSPACLCVRNPRDPSCGGRGAGTGGAFSGLNGGGTGSSSNKLADTSLGGTDLSSLAGDGLDPADPAAGAGGSGSSSNTMQGGGGGGPQNPFGGGGNRYGSGGDAGSDGGSGLYNTGVISGTSGGGGGFGGYGKGAPGSEKNGSGAAGMLAALKAKFNIKDALPDRTRGLAGMNKQAAADGITNAMGPSIWEKVSRQYRWQNANAQLLRSSGGK